MNWVLRDEYSEEGWGGGRVKRKIIFFVFSGLNVVIVIVSLYIY